MTETSPPGRPASQGSGEEDRCDGPAEEDEDTGDREEERRAARRTGRREDDRAGTGTHRPSRGGRRDFEPSNPDS